MNESLNIIGRVPLRMTKQFGEGQAVLASITHMHAVDAKLDPRGTITIDVTSASSTTRKQIRDLLFERGYDVEG